MGPFLLWVMTIPSRSYHLHTFFYITFKKTKIQLAQMKVFLPPVLVLTFSFSVLFV